MIRNAGICLLLLAHLSANGNDPKLNILRITLASTGLNVQEIQSILERYPTTILQKPRDLATIISAVLSQRPR